MDDIIFTVGTEKPEADYQRLEYLGKKLGIPVIMTYLKLETDTQDGLREVQFTGRSHTWNRNFWNNLFALTAGAPAGAATFGAGYLAYANIAGGNRAVDFATGRAMTRPQYLMPFLNKTANSSTFGIVVGTGNTAESFEHYALASQVLTGTANGQLSYVAQSDTVCSYDSGNKIWTATASRIFNNNSGANLSVAETGMYISRQMSNSGSPALDNIMVERTKLPAPVSVTVGGALTVTYTFTLTFPA